jgi:hypothetical protein
MLNNQVLDFLFSSFYPNDWLASTMEFKCHHHKLLNKKLNILLANGCMISRKRHSKQMKASGRGRGQGGGQEGSRKT